MEIKCETLDDALLEILEHLLEKQETFLTTRGETREEVGVLIEIANPLARLSRSETRGKLFSSLGEVLWYLTADNKLDFIRYYILKYTEESEDGHTVYGGYGPRLFNQRGFNQVYQVIKLLKENALSRRAVIQILNAEDNKDSESGKFRRKEVPCTVCLQFLLRNEKLDLIVVMRSNDAYIGLPHDVFCFTMLQEIICRSIGVELGVYRHFVGSMHLSDEHLPAAKEFVAERYQRRIKMPAMPTGDPWSAIDSLLKIEADIRASKDVSATIGTLDKYWQDLGRLLRIYAAQNPDEIVQLKKTMSSPIYNSYIDGLSANRFKQEHKNVAQ